MSDRNQSPWADGWAAGYAAAKEACDDLCTPDAWAEVRAAVAEECAEAIRREWVCGCVEENPDDPMAWHDCCKYSEWAARNALEIGGRK